MRRIFVGIGWVVLGLLAVLASVLAEAHWEMRGVTPDLPELPAIAGVAEATDGPVRVSYINTATQAGPGPSAVAHPAFLLEWSDGRAFLIDVGMDREGAQAFGRPIEWLMGAEPMEPHGSVSEQLGSAAQQIRAIAFTHLHPDHTGGLAALCEVLGRPLPVFQTSWQADHENFSTSPGRGDIEAAGCARVERLEGGSVYAIPEFPGLVAVAAGGHTPGSTMFLAEVRGTTWVLAGDVTNFMESLQQDRDKPRIYSLLVVPETTSRLRTLRHWLSALDARPGFTVVVSHDRDALAASGLPAWTAAQR